MIESRTHQNLSPLLNAQSVAIVGISELPRFGGVVYDNLRALGYAGRVFGVNPKYRELFGMPCYPLLLDLPERPDLAILALPNSRLLAGLRDAAEMGIPAAVIFANAHSEPRDGEPLLQEQLREIAAASGMVVCGPNCMGFHAFAGRLPVSGYPVTPLPAGNVTFITHSGSQFDALWQNRRGIRFNYLVSAGNELVTTLADYMCFALEQPTTRVIGLFMETVRDPKTFVAALETAAKRDIPVVALKVGQSSRGAELAQAHSGALAGKDAAYDALFKYYGVRRVKSPDEMLDTLEVFANGMRTPTKFISSLHDSGGERGLLVDLADREGVSFAPINRATTQRLSEILEPGLAPVNPVDAWGTGNEYDKIYGECLLALDADPSTGLNVFAVDLYGSDGANLGYPDIAEAILPQLTKPLVFMTNLAASADEAQTSRLRALGVPVLMGAENGVRAIKHLVEYSEFARRRAANDARQRTNDERRTAQDTIKSADDVSRPAVRRLPSFVDEYASAEILRAFGVLFPPSAVTDSLEETLRAGERIGYPVALKTAAGALHKSDKGGVKLNLGDPSALADAYAELDAAFGTRVLVQEMIPRGVEMILGIVNDPHFGPMLAVGLGGIFVEVFKDSCLLMLPTTRADVRDALAHLRGAALLQGARGGAAVNIEAIVDAAMALSDFALAYRHAIAAVDVNPLIALPDRAVAVDAMIVTRGKDDQR
ncbi:MAG: acetate--CoA ligase family protein [Anaerolineae bacterium]|nr:acetate--CoA ligase family protein [Anaerolineae bacterium]